MFSIAAVSAILCLLFYILHCKPNKAIHNAVHTLSKMVGQTGSKRYHVTVWATSLDSVFTFVGPTSFIKQRLASV